MWLIFIKNDINFFFFFAISDSAPKDLPPRFKRNMIPQVGAPGIIEDNISLRPTAFKTPEAKPVTPLSSGRTNSLLSEPLLPVAPQIQMTKEPPILIKQASAEKGKSAKKDKVSIVVKKFF